METGSPGVPMLGVAGWGEEMIAARQTLEGSLETESADVMSNSTTGQQDTNEPSPGSVASWLSWKHQRVCADFTGNTGGHTALDGGSRVTGREEGR